MSFAPQSRTIVLYGGWPAERVELPPITLDISKSRLIAWPERWPPYFLDALVGGTKPCRIEFRWTGVFQQERGSVLPLYVEHARKYPVDFRELDEPFDPDAEAEAFRKAFSEAHAEEKPVREAHPRGVQVYRLPKAQASRVTNCKSCGAPIVWIKTKSGRQAALDFRSAITDGGGCTMIDHYSPKVCPAGSIRRKKT